jgi:uncharacterized protein YceH (UPF0502 family)
MNEPLDEVAVRVLGALIEKEATTPQNYPLTLNSLVAACNQTSNRDPVLFLDEAAVSASLKELMGRNLVRQVHRNDSRAKRYRQSLSESWSLHPAETAALCVLMLRGAQTLGEIRSRTARQFEFRDPPHVEVTLQSLMTLATPLVMQLPRQPGQKEARYAHLLSGEPRIESGDAAPAGPVEPVEPDRLEALERAVDALRADLAELRGQLEVFKRAFE